MRLCEFYLSAPCKQLQYEYGEFKRVSAAAFSGGK